MKFCFVALKLLETNYYHFFPSAICHLPFFVINKNQKSIKRTTTIMSLSGKKVGYGSQAITADIADECAIANLFKQVGTFNLMSINLMSIVSTFFHQN